MEIDTAYNSSALRVIFSFSATSTNVAFGDCSDNVAADRSNCRKDKTFSEKKKLI